MISPVPTEATIPPRAIRIVAVTRLCSLPPRKARIAAGSAHLLLGCDLVVSAGGEALSRAQVGRTRAVINSHETITGDFTRNPDLAFPARDLEGSIANAVGAER